MRETIQAHEIAGIVENEVRQAIVAKLREIADRDDPRLHRARGLLLAEAANLDAGLPIFTLLAVGQVWRRHRGGDQGQVYRMRVEGYDERYVHGVSLRSGRSTRIIRSRDNVGGPLGYHLDEPEKRS